MCTCKLVIAIAIVNFSTNLLAFHVTSWHLLMKHLLVPRLKALQQHETLIIAFDEAFLQKYENLLVAMVRIEIITPCRTKI